MVKALASKMSGFARVGSSPTGYADVISGETRTSAFCEVGGGGGLIYAVFKKLPGGDWCLTPPNP